jgi:ABC-type dipeptide/oligopeptide/nickel transport system permease subunit
MAIGPEPLGSDLSTPIGEESPGSVGASPARIEGRSLRQIAWRRLKRDKAAMAGGVVIILLILMAILAPLIVKLLGYPPNEFHQDAMDPATQIPRYRFPFGPFSTDYLMGVEPPFGRDIFSRIVYGARISLLIAFFATVLSVLLGSTLGVIAGYFGGWVDTVISRAMDIFLAFPLLLFAIALAGVVPDNAFGLSGDALRIVLLIFIIGFFNWGYIARIIRGQALSLREREFVDAARSLGARGPYIIFREIVPNLIAPILIYATLLIPTNIIFEAALSFLGVGVRPPTATWGGMLSEAVRYYTIPHFVFWPGMAIFITVLAFNLLGDGLRDALDPKTR